MDFKDLTVSVHGGMEAEKVTGAVVPPIFQTSTYAQDKPGHAKIYDYSRGGNPTRAAFESGLARLENAAHSLAFASGLAAEQAIIQLLEPGDEVLVCDDVYGGTGRLFRNLYAKYGLEFSFLDMCSPDIVESKLSSRTKLLWVETPTNPTLKIIDIARLAEYARAVNALLVVDNTFASPIFQKPLSLGADIVIHSTTKYIGGHSDLIGGAIMLNDQRLYESLHFIQFAAGAIPSPFECFLLHRSMKTLALRMRQHASNAQTVADFLSNHPKICEVIYPGLSEHPGHELAKKQMSGFSGIVSCRLAGDIGEVEAFCSRLSLVTLAESLGGVESLVNHPESMTHASVPKSLRTKLGIDSQLIRLSVGIEDSNDIVADLDAALSSKTAAG